MKHRLKDLRLENRLTQREIADKIGCSVGAYSKYETGDREPSIETLSALADYYDVSLDFLVGRNYAGGKNLTPFENRLIVASRRTPDYMNECMLSFLEFIISKKSID